MDIYDIVLPCGCTWPLVDCHSLLYDLVPVAIFITFLQTFCGKLIIEIGPKSLHILYNLQHEVTMWVAFEEMTI